MSFLKGKTAIITGAGYAVLSDGKCGSIGYGIATAYAKEIGCAFLTLNVWRGNDSAMRFYENAGMSPRSITMEKKLC